MKRLMAIPKFPVPLESQGIAYFEIFLHIYQYNELGSAFVHYE